MKKIGIVGMATMGKNLALNIENKGFIVSIYNRSSKKTQEIIYNYPNKKFIPCYSIKEFVFSLNSPKCIFIMIKSGKYIDDFICLLEPYLLPGDILIDGGNSFYKDTIRRYKFLSKKKINFIGMGISGGEKGALTGPALMPGCEKNIYEFMKPIFKKISAYFENEACVTYIGPNGSGHYVKMIHNGIEYGNMQLISEIFFLLKKILKMNNEEISNIFDVWNQGELNSYLIEISKNILQKKDIYGKHLIDFISDKADNKKTGKWCSQDALDLDVPFSLITESVFVRFISASKNCRTLASKIFEGPNNEIKDMHFSKRKNQIIENIRRSLYFGIIISYSQGFLQLEQASKKYKWDLNLYKISKIFRSGCIIRGKILQDISYAYKKNSVCNFLFSSCFFKNTVNDYQNSARKIISLSFKNGIPIPALASSLSYYDTLRCENLPTNLIQAQRDYFGSHTYERIDDSGFFHTDWE